MKGNERGNERKNERGNGGKDTDGRIAFFQRIMMTWPPRDQWEENGWPPGTVGGRADTEPGPATEAENRWNYHPVVFRFPADWPRLEARLAVTGRALVADPADREALEERGRILVDLDREAEAEVVWDWMLKLNPLDFGALAEKGVYLMRRRRYREALALLGEALFLEPIDTELLFNKGMALMFLGEYRQAAGVFGELIEIDPEDCDGVYMAACAFALTGRPVKAVWALREAIALDTSFIGEAERNPDFDGIRGRGDFRRITGTDRAGERFRNAGRWECR
jgi:tetratricopeptide (TPR) repeat protein